MFAKNSIVKKTVYSLLLAMMIAMVADIMMSLIGDALPAWLFWSIFGIIFLVAFASKAKATKICKIFWSAIGSLIGIFAIVLVFMISFYKNSPYKSADDGKQLLYGGKNVMVFVPHEDDEINILGGVFEEFVKYGSTVRIVFMTNGESGEITTERINEAISAAALCGIKEENIFFLGYSGSWENNECIYTSDMDAKLISSDGSKTTHGTESHPAYHQGEYYTKRNLMESIKSILLEYEPDIVFCSDYDYHPDHKTLSLLFEKVMGEVLKENENYKPEVFKGFAYITSYFGIPDYYSENIISTEIAGGDSYLKNNSNYHWEERVRFPISAESVSRSLYNSRLYKETRCHLTQPARFLATSIINGDKVFWKRETTSVLYNADITVSSGDATVLADFMYIDTADVKKENYLPDKGVWIPGKEDIEKTATITFPEELFIEEIRLFDNISADDNVLNACVLFDDGTSIETGPLNIDGSASTISINKDNVKTLQIVLSDSKGINAGLSEIEIYTEKPSSSIKFIKINNWEGDFVYDYHINKSGNELFGIYAYNCSDDINDYCIDCDNSKCRAEISDNGLIVNCPLGEQCTVTISSNTEGVSDSILVSNPVIRSSFGQKIEQFATANVEKIQMTTTYNILNSLFHIFVKQHYTL